MKNKVSEHLKVQSFEVDLNSRIKPYYIQCHLQEAAYDGSAFCGVGYEVVHPMGLAWVLNRLHVSFKSLPMWGDEVRIETWSRGQQGPLWHRNYQMFKGEELLLSATSAWTVLDLSTRSLYRGVPPFDPEKHLAEDTLPFCAKLTVPKHLEMQDAGSHVPLFSEIDTNGHVNNCVYTDWALNSLPFDYLANREIRDLEVNYYREVHPGQEVSFQIAREEDTWYFRGLHEGQPCFLVKLEFDQ